MEREIERERLKQGGGAGMTSRGWKQMTNQKWEEGEQLINWLMRRIQPTLYQVIMHVHVGHGQITCELYRHSLRSE